MPRIDLPPRQHLPEASQQIIDRVQRQAGYVPNVIRLMSTSPAVLKGWAGLQEALSGRFDRHTREAIALAVSEVNGCAYCIATHSRAAEQGHTPPEEVARNRAGTSSDTALAAVAHFAAELVDKRGHVSNRNVTSLRDGVRPCGWTDSSGSFDRLLGVLILELQRAEIAER